MNIFKKLTLINKILKIINVLKKHFEQNNLTKEVKEIISTIKKQSTRNPSNVLWKATQMKISYL